MTELLTNQSFDDSKRGNTVRVTKSKRRHSSKNVKDSGRVSFLGFKKKIVIVGLLLIGNL